MGGRGLPFQPVPVPGETARHGLLPELIRWGRLFHEMGCAPSYGDGSHGNLSLRTERGCLITATKTFLGSLEESHFVEVVGCDFATTPPTVRYRGRLQPSTDSLIHWQLYQWREEVTCVLHAHDADVLRCARQMGIPQTERAVDAGSPELLPMIRPFAQEPYFVIKDHGFVAAGRTVEEEGEMALRIHERAVKLAACGGNA